MLIIFSLVCELNCLQRIELISLRVCCFIKRCVPRANTQQCLPYKCGDDIK